MVTAVQYEYISEVHFTGNLRGHTFWGNFYEINDTCRYILTNNFCLDA